MVEMGEMEPWIAGDRGGELIPSHQFSHGGTETHREKVTFLESPLEFIALQEFVPSSLGAPAHICAPQACGCERERLPETPVCASTPACVHMHV